MISSNDRAKASSPPASSAVRRAGKVTCRKVCSRVAPRSIDASSTLPAIRRSRATALLNTMTMQKVACPAMRVSRLSPPRKPVNSVLSAMPVTIPGRAIGSTSSRETLCRPKKA